MADSTKTITPLRRMLDDMTLRKLNEKTQTAYLRAVKRFTQFFGPSPELASPDELRRLQMHLVAQGVSGTTINATITGLRFFFEVTLDRHKALKKMSPVRVPQRRHAGLPSGKRRCYRLSTIMLYLLCQRRLPTSLFRTSG